jgi:hypothetical protein
MRARPRSVVPAPAQPVSLPVRLSGGMAGCLAGRLSFRRVVRGAGGDALARGLPLVLPLVLPALLASAACEGPGTATAPGARAATTTQAIINGETCDETVDPTAVAIMLDATIDFGQGEQDITQVMCTGTLIAPDVVLLAAHCLDTSALTFGFGEVPRADFYVTFEADLARFAENQSQTPLPIPATAIPVRAAVAHPGFDIQSLGQGTTGVESDIGLLFLAAAVDDVVPSVVITADEARQMSVGDAVRIAGWGQQTVTNGFFDPPPAGSVGVKQCGDSTLQEIGETLMQVGSDPSTTRKCHGDSGGPTYFDVDGGGPLARRVVGVTSRAYDQEDCNKGGVDTRVDAFLDFLDDEMRRRCDDGSRAWCDVPGILGVEEVAALAGVDATGGEGEGEGEGEGGSDGGGGGGDGGDGPVPGCAAAPGAPLLAFLAALLAPRRRRSSRGRGAEAHRADR